MTFQGDLKEIGLFDVFQNVSHNQLTGTLCVRSGQTERWIWFEFGKVRFASLGHNVGLPMRDFLVRRGYVTEEDLEAAMSRHRRGRPALRNVLEKEGKLSQEDFKSAASDRVVELLYELFGLTDDASFEFGEGKPPDGIFDRELRALDLAIDPMPVLMEAARRQDEWQRIRKVVGSERDIFVRLGDAPPEDPDLHMVWSCLDGQCEISEVEMMVPLGQFELCEAISVLVAEGLARPVGAAEITAQAEAAMNSGDHAKTRALLEHAIEIERNNRDLRRMLAELYEALEDPRQAAENWAILGYQAAIEGNDREGWSAYQRAIALAPHDLGLREKSFELLERIGGTQDFASAALDLSHRLLEHGLAERGRTVLARAMRRPDLADRPELLEQLAKIERDTGRPERGIEQLIHAAETAYKLGGRGRAEYLLEIGKQLFPEAKEIVHRLDDIRTNRRERRRQRIRKISSLVALSLFTASAGFVVFDEIMLRRDVIALLREIPNAVSSGRTTEPLGRALARYRAHPLTPSRRLFREIADGLAEAELTTIRRKGASGNYEEALARLSELRALVGPGASDRVVQDLKLQLHHQERIHRWLMPWFAAAPRQLRNQRSARAFTFEARDITQVLRLYPRLGDSGRAQVRRRFIELASPVALPLFTDLYLDGARTEKVHFGDVELFPFVVSLAQKARDKRWSVRPEVRAAYVEAYTSVVEARLGATSTNEEVGAAKQLLLKFVDPPAVWPSDREGYLELIDPK